MPDPVRGSQELAQVGPFEALDLTTSPYQVPPTRAIAATNFDPSRIYGALALTRGRMQTIISTPFAFNVLDMSVFFQTANNYIIAYELDGAGHGYFESAIPGAAPVHLTYPADATFGYLTGTRCTFSQAYGYIFMTSNGLGQDGIHGDPAVKISQLAPTTLTRWQLIPGALSPAATAVAGVLNSSSPYYYRYTYAVAASGQESSPSPVSGPYTATNNAFQFNIAGVIVSPDPQVDTIYLYRLGGASQVWTRVAAIANVAPPATYTDNLPDLSLVGASLIIHRDPPPSFNSTCEHKGRMWGFGYNNTYAYTLGAGNAFVDTPPQPADLWFSRYAEPYSFDCVNAVLPLGRDAAGDVGVGLASLSSGLFAVKVKTAWIVLGDSEQDFRAIKVFEIGGLERSTLQVGYGLAFWLSRTGVWMFDGNSRQNISNGDPNQKVPGIKTALGKLLSFNSTRWRGAIFDQTYYLTNLDFGLTYGFYIPTQTWFQLSFSTRGITSFPEDGLCYALTATNRQVDQWFARDGDDYGPLICQWQTGCMDAGMPHIRKTWEYAVARIPCVALNSGTVQADFFVDGRFITTAVLTPRGPGAIANTGLSYFRIGMPNGTKGYEMSIVITLTQNGTLPVSLDRVSVYGSMGEEGGPVTPANGST